ncbi:MAG: RluA family pseudouridine synthase [Acutalibacter sp.]|nr:RluA family pseudouridine synthase [Acutalibacter sp.]
MTRRLSYAVPLEWEGAAVKDFAKKALGFSAHVLAQQKRAEGGILLNGEPVFATALLKTGDMLSFCLPLPEGTYPPEKLPFSVLSETEDFLVVHKPAGMPVHPSPGHDRDSLLNGAAYYYQAKGALCPLLCPLYRLDRDTSGTIALGKHTLAVSGTALEKTYFALCQGTLSERGTIDVPIGLEEGSKIKRQCGSGQRAVTHWEALESGGGHTLLAVRLETGRTHQIRAHFSYMGYPLAGDDLYGGSHVLIGRQALHCGVLHMKSAALDMDRTFAAGFPPDMKEAFPWLPEVGDIMKSEKGRCKCQPA